MTVKSNKTNIKCKNILANQKQEILEKHLQIKLQRKVPINSLQQVND